MSGIYKALGGNSYLSLGGKQILVDNIVSYIYENKSVVTISLVLCRMLIIRFLGDDHLTTGELHTRVVLHDPAYYCSSTAEC